MIQHRNSHVLNTYLESVYSAYLAYVAPLRINAVLETKRLKRAACVRVPPGSPRYISTVPGTPCTTIGGSAPWKC
jgi:hypothetical protein